MMDRFTVWMEPKAFASFAGCTPCGEEMCLTVQFGSFQMAQEKMIFAGASMHDNGLMFVELIAAPVQTKSDNVVEMKVSE